MFVFQFEIGFRMIKIVVAFDDEEGNFRVALLAVLPEFILVNICMTVVAVGKLRTCKFLEFSAIPRGYCMALDAIHGLVHPCQWELCGSMVEFCDGFKGIAAMTVCTGS